MRQSSIKALLPGGKQQPQQCPLLLNTALLGSDFTQKCTHTEGPMRIDRVMLLSSLSVSYPLPHTSYKTLKVNFKSFFASTSTFAKQEQQVFLLPPLMLYNRYQGPRVSISLPCVTAKAFNIQQSLPTMKQVVVKMQQVLHHDSRTRVKQLHGVS